MRCKWKHIFYVYQILISLYNHSLQKIFADIRIFLLQI